MALKDRFKKAIGRDHQRSSSVSTGSGGNSRTGTGGTTTPNHDSPLTLTATSTNQGDGHPMTKDAAQTHIGNNNTPAITLTKTHSRLTKSLTWGAFGSNKENKENKPSKKEIKDRKAIENWKKQDADEWSAPSQSRPGRKNQKCQDTLRAFDFKQFENDTGVRSRSICSGISPNASRANSVADGDGLVRVLSGGRKRSSVGKGSLSQEIEAVNEPNGKVKEQRMTSVGEE